MSAWRVLCVWGLALCAALPVNGQNVERQAGSGSALALSASDSAKPPAKPFAGLCYGPFRDNEDPDLGILPLPEGLDQDLGLLAKVTGKVRTYGCGQEMGEIPRLCQKHGLDCYLGVWLGKYPVENEKEVEAAIKLANSNLACIKAIIVGNEVQLRHDLTLQQHIAHIRRIKQAVKVPVTTAEIWQTWLDQPRLAQEVDFLLVHIHPYWEKTPIEEAVPAVVKTWRRVKAAFPAKTVIIGETGWPSAGENQGAAKPSDSNQGRFNHEFVAAAKSEAIDYFLFEAFDESWKSKFEGESGGGWGACSANGRVKPQNLALFPKEAADGISRPPRQVKPVVVQAPLVVYRDGAANENHFQPSGWIGDQKGIELDPGCKDHPHQGASCIRITYDPRAEWTQGWSGIYWQYPLNNWGKYPGYVLTGATKLEFWARGANGTELAEFKTGGIANYNEPNKDSFGPVSTGLVRLSQEWRKYTIDLRRADTSRLIGGFCWVTNTYQNSEKCTIYLDDIVFLP